MNSKDGAGEKEHCGVFSLKKEMKEAHNTEKGKTSVAGCSVINHLHESPAVPSPVCRAVLLTQREKALPQTQLVKQYYSHVNSQLQQNSVGPCFQNYAWNSACVEGNYKFSPLCLGIYETWRYTEKICCLLWILVDAKLQLQF